MGSPAERLRPFGWGALAVGGAVIAGALAGDPSFVQAGSILTRVLGDVAGVGCVGTALVGELVFRAPPAGRSHRANQAVEALRTRIDRSLLAASGVWVLALLLGTVFRAADAFGRSPTELGSREILLWATELGAGRGTVLTIGCALVVLGCAVARQHAPERVDIRIVLVAALLGVITPAVTGHTGATDDHQLAVVTIAVHVAAAALWAGGLCALLAFVGRDRELLDAALPQFSTLATVCLVAVAVSGVLSAAVRLESWTALLTTGYGDLVSAKAAALATIGVFGALTRRRLRSGRLPVLRWAGYETAAMAVAIGLAAALTQTGFS